MSKPRLAFENILEMTYPDPGDETCAEVCAVR